MPLQQAPLPPADPASTFAPLRQPLFRAIWIANLFSNLGAMMQSVGAAWLMTDLTPSRQLVALVQASSVLPVLVLSLLAGAIADNFDRRRIMLFSQLAMLVVSTVLALLAYAGGMTPALLLSFTLAIGAGTALNVPAWQASVRQQVPDGQLPQAIALNSISFNIARSVGPALGGLAMSLWSVSAVFAFNAMSYLGLIVVLLRWRPEPRAIARHPMVPAILAGLRYSFASHPLRAVILRGLAMGSCLIGYQALLPSVVKGELHGSETDYGVMLGMFGLGSIMITPFIGTLRRRFGLEGIVAMGSLASCLALVDLALAPSLAVGLPASFVAGAGWVSILITLNTAVQLRAPEEIMGRCLSHYRAVTFGGMAAGSWWWGTLADWDSLPVALLSCAGAVVLCQLGLRVLAPLPRPGEGFVR